MLLRLPLWHTVHAKSYPSCTRRVTGLTGCGSIIRSTTPVPKASTTNGKIDIQGKSNARTINPSKNLQASTAVQHIVGLSTFRFCQKIQNAFPAIGYNKIWSKVGLILDRRSILRPVLSVLSLLQSCSTNPCIVPDQGSNQTYQKLKAKDAQYIVMLRTDCHKRVPCNTLANHEIMKLRRIAVSSCIDTMFELFETSKILNGLGQRSAQFAPCSNHVQIHLLCIAAPGAQTACDDVPALF